MRLLPLPEGGLRLRLDHDEAQLLDRLVTQLTALLQSHSSTALDPDPLFASLEVGGSDATPEDPALARLFPDAFEDEGDASAFRRLTEQGLVNRKLQDALEVTGALGLGAETLTDETASVEIDVTEGPGCYGGMRRWFRCPRCAARTTVIGVSAYTGGVGCRKCWRWRKRTALEAAPHTRTGVTSISSTD